MELYNMLRYIFTVSAMLYCCAGQFLTSSFHLERLLSIEQTMIKKLLVYIDRQSVNNITFDESILSFIELARQKNQQDTGARDLDTPLSGYRVLKRLVKDWGELKKNMSCTDDISCPLVTGEDVIDNVLKKESDLPTEDDLQASALAIVNVWNVYGLELDDVTSGRLPAADDKPLSADDIFYIADAAKQAGKTYEAITWFEYLLGKLKDFPAHDFKVTSLYQRLAGSYHEHGVTSKAVTLLNECLKSDPANTRISRDLQYFARRAKKSKLSKVLRFQEDDTSKKMLHRKQYERLCQMAAKGEYPVSNLTCELVPLLNFYGQAKVETLSTRPKIQRYYDVVNDTGAAEWRGYSNFTFGQLTSMFPATEYTISSPHMARSGAMCEATTFNLPLLRKVTDRLEQMTGFHLLPKNGETSSLCYEMTNEGNGGSQRIVTDYRTPLQMYNPNTPFRSAGNKLASIILQLSDVSYGGDIVFPRADLYVPVVKGSAVVVWNLRDNGMPDPRSARVNCPVVVGNKWTALKHVFYKNQLFRRRCEVQI